MTPYPSRLSLQCKRLAIAATLLWTHSLRADPVEEIALKGGLDRWDFLVLAIYILMVLGMGCYYHLKQRSADEYFVGNRKMSPFLIGISLYASMLSTLSYLAYPGEIIQHGPIYLTGVLSVPIAYYIVGYVLLPVYMKQQVTSAYELLEAKLGIGARITGAVLFILLRLAWMALLIYLASSALLLMTGLDARWLPAISAATGTVAILYASMGGLRAVVWTDLFQFALLFGGAVFVIGQITFRMGGFHWFPTEWSPSWDAQPVFSLDPTVRATLIGMVVMQLVFRVCTAGSDQTMVQRFMATQDAAAARRSYLVQSIAAVAVTVFLGLMGFALLGFFQAHPEMLGSPDLTTEGDSMFPLYIANFLPSGFSGLIVSALFAAGMSSIDSGVNSITAVVRRDFLDRFNLAHPDPNRSLRFNKILAGSIGITVILLSLGAEHVPGNFLEVAQRTANLLIPALFGLFIYALFIPFATGAGALLGTLSGCIAAVLIGFWEPFTGLPSLSFQWIGLGSLIANMAVGVPMSYLTYNASRATRKWRIRIGTITVILAYILILVVASA